MSQWTSSFSLIGPTGPAGTFGVTGTNYGDYVYYDGASWTVGSTIISIGAGAGQISQGAAAIALGQNAGNNTQSASAVAIGDSAGRTNQGLGALAFGGGAGYDNQGAQATAVGNGAGNQSQGAGALAFGNNAGFSNQGANSVAIGSGAGSNAQGINAIAIGNGAGNDFQTSNSIVFNASGAPLTASTIGLYIDPIRHVEPANQFGLFHDVTTKEVIYNSIITISSVSTLVIAGNIIPDRSEAYTLGTSSSRYTALFVGPGSLNIAGPSNASATIGTDAAGIIYTESGFATPFVNLGPSELTPQAVGGWRIGPTGTQATPGYDLIAQEIQANGSGPTGPSYSVINGLGNQYASFISETTQSTISVSTVAITYDERTTVNGILNIENNSYPGSKIIIPMAGTYKFVFSAQVDYSGAGNNYMAIWPGINGVFVDKSNTRIRLPQNVETCLTVEYVLECGADDYVEFFMAANSTAILLKYFPEESAISGVTIPSVPSIIVTVMRIF